MKKTKITTGYKTSIFGNILHRPGFRNKVKKTVFGGKFLAIEKSAKDKEFGNIGGAIKQKMMTFERMIIGLMSLCTAFLVVVAVNSPSKFVPQSPKANFDHFNADLATASGTAGTLRTFKQTGPSGIKHLTVGNLLQTFSTLDYDFENVRDEGASVPRIFVVAIPQDMLHIRVPAERKRIFFKTVLPLVLKANDDILKDRQRVLRIRETKNKTGKITVADRLWLAAMAERYDVDRYDLNEMVRRIDIIPPSLALAQAAEESGWGTSRFALEGNAIFGQWTFSNKASLKPQKRDDDKDHRVRAFTSLIDAVKAYIFNLNTHRAYRQFRQERLALRVRGQRLTGTGLASTLSSYSERGSKYVRTIQSIIIGNQLQSLDKARLGGKKFSVENKPVI